MDTSSPEPFADLLARARTGDPSALDALSRGYEPEVRLVARLRLGAALRPYLDSMDLVQSVHRSLMVGLRANKFVLNSPQDLIALAVTVVRRKAARHWQRLQRQQRDSGYGAREGNLPDLLVNLSTPNSDPSADATYRDTVDKICRLLDPSEQQLLELHLQGYRTVDVAKMLNLNADVLRVKLSRLRQRLRTSGITAEMI